jgi:hypothetical protein
MAPGFTNIPSSVAADTVDSFEILEQTVMKQKRLAKKKKCDLRVRILLKRTFDLVCEIMDRENGFDDDYIDSNNTSSIINNDYSNYSDSKNEKTEDSMIQEESASTLPPPQSNVMSEIELESIPLPADDYSQKEDCQVLTNVQNINKKRKSDDFSNNNCSSGSNSCNKKPRLVNIGIKVIKNEF